MTADGSSPRALPTETPLEGFRRLFPIEVRPLMPQIRYRPLDTNVLLKNIARDVRGYPVPTAIRLLGVLGALRLYVGPHVVSEVEEHIDAHMLEQRLDVAFARWIWEHEYMPRLWVVDPALLWSQDKRIATLADRDPDDLPTGRLAILLGQKALSEDPDLTDYGLASGEPWLRLVFAVGSVAKGETVDFGIVFGASVSMTTVAEVVGAGRQLAATPGGKRALLVIGVGFVLVVLGAVLLRQLHEPSRQWIDEKARGGVRALASGGKVAFGAYASVSLSRVHGEIDLQAGVVADGHSPTPIQVAARTLAVAAAPVTTRDLAAAVWAYKRVPAAAKQRLRALLESVPAFVETAPDRWQLAQRALPSTEDRGLPAPSAG